MRYVLDLTCDPARSTVDWTFVEGEIVTDSTGGWRFTAEGDGTTIDYRAALDVQAPLPGFILRKVTDGLVAASLPNMFASIEREVRGAGPPGEGRSTLADVGTARRRRSAACAPPRRRRSRRRCAASARGAAAGRRRRRRRASPARVRSWPLCARVIAERRAQLARAGAGGVGPVAGGRTRRAAPPRGSAPRPRRRRSRSRSSCSGACRRSGRRRGSPGGPNMIAARGVGPRRACEAASRSPR